MKQMLKQRFVLSTVGALVAAPLLNPIALHAAPQVPVLNKLNEKIRAESLTLNGVVTKDLEGAQFYFKADDGRAFRVVAPKGEPKGLVVGERIEVRGVRDAKERDVIVATDVTRPVAVVQGESLTVNGVMTRDLVGNQFNFRAEDDRTFRVVVPKGEPVKLAVGDRITVRGVRDAKERDVIVADNVSRIVDTSVNTGQGEYLTLSGVVTRDLNGAQFNFRTDDGRTFRIAMRGSQPKWLNSGDRIEVSGRRDATERDLIVADSARPLGGAGVASENVSLFGLVTRNLPGNVFEMRTGDGKRLIRVTAQNGEPAGLSIGNDVRADGVLTTSRNEITMAAGTVEIVDKHRGVGDASAEKSSIGANADLSGVAMRVSGRTRLEVRADNGRVFNVTSDNKFAAGIKNGDRVRVTGKWSGVSAVRADRVVLEAQNVPPAANGAVNFWGRVESVSNNGLLRNLKVRGDNGWVYSVQYRNLQAFRVGDRVHVTGSISNGVVNATAIAKG